MENELEYLEEGENSPTNPALWSRAKAAASKKFTKHSAYKMAWASRWYKSKGGGWRKKKKANESIELNEALKDIIMEDLRDWFSKDNKKGNWKRISTSGEIAGECGTSKDKPNPDRCLPAAKAYSLSKAERAATAKKKKTKSKGGRKQFVANTKKAKVKT